MKIKSSINKNVTEAVDNCRKIIVNETINLLKQMGVKAGQDVFFGRTLFLYQTKDNVSNITLVNNIAYGDRQGCDGYYIVSMIDDERFCKSDIMLSISNLQIIYEEVKKVVRAY